jgi:hypothetical protein
VTALDLAEELAALAAIPTSHLGHHDGHCCHDAEVLILGRLIVPGRVDASLASVPLVVEWAPTHWPANWCEVLTDERGDCGVHAALASAVLGHFGIVHRRARAALRPEPGVQAHWQAQWDADGVATRWLANGIVHHEVIGIGDEYWDPTEARWIAGPGARVLAGEVIAVREDGSTWQGLDWIG